MGLLIHKKVLIVSRGVERRGRRDRRRAWPVLSGLDNLFLGNLLCYDKGVGNEKVLASGSVIIANLDEPRALVSNE